MTLKGSRTVATGGVEKRTVRHRALLQPTFGFRVDREVMMNLATQFP
jgi:hypothetical protein